MVNILVENFYLLFAIKSIKLPTTQFNIQDYINFSSANTRSGAVFVSSFYLL